jgi:hypothetical protein
MAGLSVVSWSVEFPGLVVVGDHGQVSADAQLDNGGVVDGEDAGAGKGPAGRVPAGLGVRGGGLVVSLP